MGRKANNGNIHPFSVASMMINNQQNIADTFNNYFLSKAENIDVNKKKTCNNINSHTINDSSLQFMSQIFTTPYTNIKRKPTSIKEIEKLMKSLTSQKIHTDMTKFALLLKICSPFVSSPLNYVY